MVKLNKTEICEVLTARLQIPYTAAERFLNCLENVVYETLRDGGKVNWSGFGQFSVSYREARVGVNPRPPHMSITIPALNTPKFRAGERFKAAVKLEH